MSRFARWPRLALLLAGLAGMVAAAGGAWLATAHRLDIVEYRMLEAQDTPTAIAAGADGTIWFTLDLADALGRIRDGRVERLRTVGKLVEPIGLAVDADGGVWHTATAQRAIARLSPSGDIVTIGLDTPIVRLGRMAAAPDGAIWFAEATAHSISRLKDGTVRRHEFESPRGGPYGVAAGADGTVWATLQSGNQLLRIDAGGAMTAYDLPRAMATPTDVAVAPDGAVWFVEFRGNAVGRFKGGRFEDFPLGERNVGLSGLAVAPDGAAWFGLMRTARIGRVRDGMVTTFELPSADARPYSVAVDPAGNVWYADLRGRVGMLPAAAARR